MKKTFLSILLSLSVAATPAEDCHDPSICEVKPTEQPKTQPTEAEENRNQARDCLVDCCFVPVTIFYLVPCLYLYFLKSH